MNRRTRRSTRAADRAFSQIKGFWPPPGYLGRYFAQAREYRHDRSVEVNLEISLEHIDDSSTPNTFRVAFHSAAERCLLPYPSVTGLTFTDATGIAAAEWKTRYLVSQPLDDFVMNPGARIAFDLYANINASSEEHRWVIGLPPGEYGVYYSYQVDRDTEWYDFLAKRSRFAAMTPIWRGAIQSNTVRFRVMDAEPEHTK